MLNSSQLHVSLLGKLLQLMSFLEVEIGTGKFHTGGNPAMDWHRIPGGSRNTPNHFLLRKPA